MELKKEESPLPQTDASPREETAMFTNNYHAWMHCTSLRKQQGNKEEGTYIMPKGVAEGLTQEETRGPSFGRWEEVNKQRKGEKKKKKKGTLHME